MSGVPPSDRATVKRLSQRGVYDRAAIHQILDEGLICHVGFTVHGQPHVIPTIYVRVGERICIHGSPVSRMLNVLREGADTCVTIALVDGLVLARSAFHHSMNYRSVVLFGKASAVEDPERKAEVLRALSEHLIPGRWDAVREPTEQELKQTLVVAIPIEEASAKVRTGPPVDDEADYALPVWAGVIPLGITSRAPVPDPKLWPGIEPPEHVVRYQTPGSSSPR